MLSKIVNESIQVEDTLCQKTDIQVNFWMLWTKPYLFAKDDGLFPRKDQRNFDHVYYLNQPK